MPTKQSMGTITPDLQVVSLRYSVEPHEGFSYDSPPPLSCETPEARFHLTAGVLTCAMKVHFSEVKAARLPATQLSQYCVPGRRILTSDTIEGS